MEALLVRHSLSLTLGRNALIRRAVNDIEDLVRASSETNFAQPQLIPVPDELDPEIPRVIFTSQAGYSQLLVSQISVTFNVSYSADWSADPDRCLAYLLSKADLLFEIAKTGWKGISQPSFSGVTTAFRMPADSRKGAVAMLAPFFANCEELKREANELSCRWSLNVGQDFFNNISAQTYLNVDESRVTVVNGVPRISNASVTNCGVEIASDYNDRMAFNERDEYSSSTDIVKEMLRAGYDAAQGAVQTIRQGISHGR